jgi:hypothetical protein
MANTKKRVLITGASGTIGSLVWKNLGDNYKFSGISRRSVEGIPPDSLRYDIFDVVSDNKWAVRDNSHAREVLGYSPKDSSDGYTF